MAIISYSIKPTKKISQTEIKDYNQFRNIRTQALIWLQINTDAGNKIKVETEAKEREHKILDLFKIDIIKV